MAAQFLRTAGLLSSAPIAFVVSNTDKALSVVLFCKLRTLFANHGIPESIVSDNGSSFTSAEMKEFLTANGVKQITSSPYHPSSNGLAERAIQTCKSALKKMDESSLDIKVQRFRAFQRFIWSR